MFSSLCTCTRSTLANGSSITSLFNRLTIAPLVTTRGFKGNRKATRKDSNFGVQTDDELMPPYPYGPRRFYKQADNGLYGGRTVQYGNKISKGRNKGKTRRRWDPHVKLEDLESVALGRTITIRVTYACLRTIRKCGGLDEYLLGDKPARIKELGLLGWKLRWKVMNSPMMKEKFAAERANLGLPPQMGPVEPFESAWKDPAYREKAMAEQMAAWRKLAEADERFVKHVESKWEPKDKTEYEKKRMIPDFEVKALPLLENLA